MPNPKFSFRLTPKEAIAYLQSKGFKQSFDYDEIMHEAHHRSFTVAKIMRDDLLQDIHHSLTAAKYEGIGFSEWHKNITPTLKRYGWHGETEVLNPKTGEIKTIYVGARRLRTIYQTNMRVSHAVARYRKLKALPFSVYWMYVSALLPTTRTSHAEKHGTVLHRDDPWWDSNYPPNDWNCKCKARAYSKKELDKRGIEIQTQAPEKIATSDWDYHVGRSGAEVLSARRKKSILDAPKALKQSMQTDQALDTLYTQALDPMPSALAAYLLRHRPKMRFKQRSQEIGADAHYLPSKKEIAFLTDTPEPWQVRHELAHHIDNINGWISLKKLKSSVLLERHTLSQTDEALLIQWLQKHQDPAIHDLVRLHYPKIIGVDTRPEGTGDLSWAIKETFANILEIMMSADQRTAIIQEYFPLSYKRVQSIIKELE